MAIQYITANETNFSLGIDARSAENQIAEGFAKDLLNADIVEKRPRTRRGYQGYAGNIPVRVTKFEYVAATNQMLLTLDSAVELSETDVDLGSIRSTPVVIYGKSSIVSSGGPFTTAGSTSHYYTGFTIPTVRTFVATDAAPPYETYTVDQSEHGITTTDMFVAVVESTSQSSRDYQTALAHDIALNESSVDLTVQYQNSTGVDRPVYTYYKDETPVTGSSYVASLSHSGGGAQTFSIPASAHALSNFNVVAQIQIDNGSSRSITQADQLTLAVNGDITVTLTSDAATTFYLILDAAPVPNQAIGSISAGITSSIELSGLTSPWIFYSIYLETNSSGDKELIYPDSISFDDATSTATVQITNGTDTAKKIVAYYDYGLIRSNQLAVVDSSISVNAVDDRPELTLWGLDHTEIYASDASTRSGWANHIDSYRSAGERRMITGLGGNLFSARSFDQAAVEFDFAWLYPNLQARTDFARVLGPLLWDSGDTPARTRGYITADGSGTGWATVTAVEYDPDTTWTIYTISLPNMQVLNSSGSPASLTDVISTDTDTGDWLTVRQMSVRLHEGVFPIRQVATGTNSITVWVENTASTSDWDDANVSGQAAVFTDQFEWSAASQFLPGDVLTNAAIPDTLICSVYSSSGVITVVGGIVDRLEVAGGILTTGTRTSDVIPLRSSQPTSMPSVLNLVRGDMLSYATLDSTWDDRLLRVLYINPDTDRSVLVTADGETATVTMEDGDTSYLVAGRSIVLTSAGPYSGVHEILDIPSQFKFTFATTLTTGVLGVLKGKTAQLDESFTWSDSTGDATSFYTSDRWIPVEAPNDSYNLTPSTFIRYFDADSYGDQSFLRSTMVQDNMYLTNGSDEVYKYDGDQLYRAGLFPWQPGLFVTQDTSVPGKLVISNRTVGYTTASPDGGYVSIASADQLVLPVGTDTRLSGSTETYTVRDIQLNPADLTGATAYIYFDRALDSTVTTSGMGLTVAEIATFRYYFRLNAVDANNNTIASAVTGYQDHVIQLAANAAVNLKLVGMPAWDVYDYERLEVEIYRTKQSTPAPFYKIATVQMDFDNTQGYVDYTDTFVDTDLIELDAVSTALKGTELGLSWQEPLRAKFVTSISNSMVMGNLRDYPQLDIQILADGTVDNSTYAGKIVTFRRDAADTGATTDMTTRARYEFVNGSTDVADMFAVATNTFHFIATSLPGTVAAGHWIYLSYDSVATTGRDLTYSGWWQIASITGGTTVHINLVGAAAATTYPNRYTIATDSRDVPVLLGTDGNLGQVNGDSFDLFDTMRRMSMAINSSMRMVDITLSGFESFTPWMTARSGNDVGKSGRLIVRQPRVDATTLEIELPSSFSDMSGISFQMFVNDIRRSASDLIQAVTRIYPSRIIVSYENFPEIIDNPTSVLDTESDSAIDINPADGQEITGILPFFGSAAFTAAQQTAVLIVFKTNSIYLVDINEKRAGRDPIQRIETEGLGCTAPYSIAVSKNAIMFANESGIYGLRRDQSIQYIGRYMERFWTEKTDLNQLSIAQGHHYGVGRVYKLSVPLLGATRTTDVYVYNHTGEDDGTARQGAWSRYDNHPATGWANLGSDAFFSSSTGRVFSLRDTGSQTDYRDDSTAITFQLDTRAMDYGNAGIRKVVDASIVHYRTTAPVTSASFEYSVDMTQEYTETTPINLRRPNGTTGIDDRPAMDILSVRHKTDRRRGIYFQARISCNSIDEPIEVAGISFKVGGLNEKGILQAAQTK